MCIMIVQIYRVFYKAHAVNRWNESPLCLIAHARVVVRHAVHRLWCENSFSLCTLISRSSRFRGDKSTWREIKPCSRVVEIFHSRGNECVIKAPDTGRTRFVAGHRLSYNARAVNKACKARRSRTSLFARVHRPPTLFLAAFVSASSLSSSDVFPPSPMARQ